MDYIRNLFDPKAKVRKKALSVRNVIEYMMPRGLRQYPFWPGDAFAVTASILKQSGAYTEIVNSWPPTPHTVDSWQVYAEDIAKQWVRVVQGARRDTWPETMDAWWRTVLAFKDCEISGVAKNQELLLTLVSIVAVCDEVSTGFGFPLGAANDRMVIEARLMAEETRSLGRVVDASRAYVLPKMHNPLVGMTMRSLTHNLALWENCEVTPIWRAALMNNKLEDLNLLLLPWPLEIDALAFKALEADHCPVKMSPEYGFFAYDHSRKSIDRDLLRRTVRNARAINPNLHALVFPELSMTEKDFDDIRFEFGELLVVAGVGDSDASHPFGRNRVAIGWPGMNRAAFQDKHHRWQLDRRQIDDYDLSSVLPDKDYYWEAIGVKPRTCSFFNVNDWLTLTALVCEDLARQDPVAELVRSVGPNLVMALLLDGPQLKTRWPARYATILADDPRSSVLTLTSAGLVARSNRVWEQSHPGDKAKMSIGLWQEAGHSPVELVLGDASVGILLELEHEMRRERTADGRHDGTYTGYVKMRKWSQVS